MHGFVTELQGPIQQGAGHGIAHVIKIGGAELGILQHDADTVGVARSNGGNALLIRTPGARII